MSDDKDSSSLSSETSTTSPTSSYISDGDDDIYTEFKNNSNVSFSSGFQSVPVHQQKVILEHHQQQNEPPVFMEPSIDMSSDDSEDVGSDPALVIAEDGKGQTKRVIKKDPSYAPRQGCRKKKPPAKLCTCTAANMKKHRAAKPKPLSAYMLWCTENRKKIVAASGNIGFSNIGRKMGEAWQALTEKEKMEWKNKAKRLALANTGRTKHRRIKGPAHQAASGVTDELIKGFVENTVLGTAPIDAAAHLKLLGDSLTVIGQRLIEHEGQLAVFGFHSVLLDTILCAVGPLLCLTTEIAGLEHLDTNIHKKILDHIAYFMPGV